MALHGRGIVHRNPSLSRTFTAQPIVLNADSGIFILAGSDVADFVVRITGPGPIGIPITEREPSEPFSAQIVASGGSFAVSGTAASLERGIIFSAESGAFSETGTAASLEIGYEVSAAAGAYAIAGTDASLERGLELNAEAGAFVLTGSDATLTVSGATQLDAESGSFAVTGTVASLKHARLFDAESGAIVVTGSDAALKKGGLELAAGSGFFSVLGTAVDFRRDLEVVATSGSFAVTGTDASLDRSGLKMPADSGAFVVTGTAATFHRPSTAMASSSGAFAVTGLASYLDYRVPVTHLANVDSRIYVRPPPSVILQGRAFATAAPGVTLYSEIQHPTEDRVFLTGMFGASTEMAVFDISDRENPAFVGYVTDATGIMGNAVIQGLAFDSTGRYLYATSGATSLYTFDLGAAFADIDDPSLVHTEVISQGTGKHVVHRVLEGLYILADTVTNNSFQVVDISTPASPAVTSTDSLTGVDIEAVTGHLTEGGDEILYPASDASGKIIGVPFALPSSFEVLQLPTIGGLQIRCSSGIAFSPDETAMVVSCFFLNGTIHHSILLVYDVEISYGGTGAFCTNEEVLNGAIARLRSQPLCTSPRIAFFSGDYWNDGNDVLHLAIAVRDDNFGEVAELRFYAWGAGGDYSRSPRFSGSTRILNSYSMRARNGGAVGNEWLSVGVSDDRTNVTLALLQSDLLESNPDYVNDWFRLTDAHIPGQELNAGMDSDGHVASSGRFEFLLDNSQFNDYSNLGGYSPDSQNPVTPAFRVGSPVIWTLDATVTFYGTIADISPDPGRYEERSVKVTCADAMELLHTTNVERLPLLSNITTDEAIKIAFDRVPYHVGLEKLTASEDSYSHDYINDRAYDEKTKVIAVIKQLIDSSQGFFYPNYLGSLGGVVYKSLDDYKIAPAFNGAHTILDDTKIEGLDLDHSLSEVYNYIVVRYYPRRVDTGANTVLFTMQGRIRVKVGETIQIDAQYRDPTGLASRVGGLDMVYPVVGTDYTFRTGKNGGGANINAQLSVSAEFGGTGARIVVSNAGPEIGWFKTQLRGNGVYTQEPIEIVERDADSITKYGMRDLTINAQYIDNEDDARLLAKAHLEAKHEPRTFARRSTYWLETAGPTLAAMYAGHTAKVGAQEEVTGLEKPHWWTLGTGQLGDTAGSDNTNLYGLDIYSIQKIRIGVESQGLVKVSLGLLPEDSTVRISSWIDPRADWLTGEPVTAPLISLHLYDDVRAIWHLKATQSADVAKTDTTLTDATDAAFFIEAGETWQFFSFMFLDSTDPANAKLSVVGYDPNLNDISSLLSGRIMLWGNGDPLTTGTSASFGTGLNADMPAGNEEVVVLSARVTSPISGTIQVQVAQNTASGTTTFRQLSMVFPFLVEKASV